MNRSVSKLGACGPAGSQDLGENLICLKYQAGSERQIERAEWHQMRGPKILLQHIISNFSQLPVRQGDPKNDQLKKGDPLGKVGLDLLFCRYLILYQNGQFGALGPRNL